MIGFILYVIYLIIIFIIGNKLLKDDLNFVLFAMFFAALGGVILLINL